MTVELQSAIEEIYVAFADLPRPCGIAFCSHCRTHEQVEPLERKPLQEITSDELSRYAFCAFTTMGEVPDFLYLLPRILDLMATDSRWGTDVEVVLPKLKEAGFLEWSETRRVALFRYFDAVLDDILIHDVNGWKLDGWICALGRLLDNVAPYLQRIERHPAQVLSYYENNFPEVSNGHLGNDFWDHDLVAYQQVLTWFNSPEIKKMTAEMYGL